MYWYHRVTFSKYPYLPSCHSVSDQKLGWGTRQKTREGTVCVFCKSFCGYSDTFLITAEHHCFKLPPLQSFLPLLPNWLFKTSNNNGSSLSFRNKQTRFFNLAFTGLQATFLTWFLPISSMPSRFQKNQLDLILLDTSYPSTPVLDSYHFTLEFPSVLSSLTSLKKFHFSFDIQTYVTSSSSLPLTGKISCSFLYTFIAFYSPG